ncbi:MAG: hypothetical protein LC647_07520, partial [Beggiatoa sp.]|nr:hypothetical protein [Beggiatoa sp.]
MVQGPGQGVGGGFVSADQQRDQLVDHDVDGHELAILVAGPGHQGQHVGAGGAEAVTAAAAQNLVAQERQDVRLVV